MLSHLALEMISIVCLGCVPYRVASGYSADDETCHWLFFGSERSVHRVKRLDYIVDYSCGQGIGALNCGYQAQYPLLSRGRES